MGRHRKSPENLKSRDIRTRVIPAIAERVDAIAAKEKLESSDIVRRAIDFYFDSLDEAEIKRAALGVIDGEGTTRKKT